MIVSTKVNLSSVLTALREFYTIHDRVYCKLNDTYFDLMYKTLEDKLHLFIYCISLFCEDVSKVILVEDVAQSDIIETDIFDLVDYEAIKPLLSTYGIVTDDILRNDEVSHFVVVSLKDCDQLASKEAAVSTFGLGTCISVYFDDVVSVDDRSKLSMYLNVWEKYGITFDVWNASIQSLHDTKEVISGGLLTDDCFVLNGSYVLKNDNSNRCIFWLICNTPDKEEVTANDYINLYNELKQRTEKTFCVSQEYLTAASNPLVEQYVKSKRISTTESISIPDRFLIMLALLHLVKGVSIEFSGFAYSIEDRYLSFVADLFSYVGFSVCMRINHVKHLDLQQLYFTKVKNIYCPAKIQSKNSTLYLRACEWDMILSAIREDQNIKNNFIICTGSYDFSSEGIYTEADFNLFSDSVIVYSLEDLLQIIYSQYEFDSIASFESYLYKLLRYLEQKCYQYKRICTLADIVFFETAGKLYIGLADIDIKYEAMLYLCAENSINTIIKEITDILPASIIYSEDLSSQFYMNVLKTSGCPAYSAVTNQFLDNEIITIGLLQAYGVTSIPECGDLCRDILSRFYSSSNYYVRKHDWKKLCNIFTSYGLRDLNAARGPLTIYGGCNTYIDNGYSYIAVYPISTEQCPYQKEV